MAHGPVRVPEDAALGEATITFVFENWSAREVASSTMKILVVSADEDEEDAG